MLHAIDAIPISRDRDGALVHALRRQEPTAPEHLVATYGSRAYRLAIRITGDAHDAEEVVQDAFMAVVRKIDTFRADAAFGSWLYRIVANAAYQKLRAQRSRRSDRPLDEVLASFDEHGRHARPLTDWSEDLDHPSIQTELRMVLTAAIDALPEMYRTVVLLHDVEGLSNRDIGEVLGLSLPNVKSRVHRARLFLRKRLEDYVTAARADASTTVRRDLSPTVAIAEEDVLLYWSVTPP